MSELASKIEAIENERYRLADLCGTILATLRVPANRENLRQGIGADELFDMADRWWDQWRELNPHPIISQLAAANERAEKAERERDAIIQWATVCGEPPHKCVFTEGCRYRAKGGTGFVYADTPEAAIRKAAGLEEA